MVTDQATISITMSVSFAPERLTCTVLPGTERRVIKTVNPNTKKNPKTNPNYNDNPPNNMISIFREIQLLICFSMVGILLVAYGVSIWLCYGY